MAPKIRPQSKQKHVSPKCDVYNFWVLFIELVNGSQFTLKRLKGKIHKCIQWARKIHVEEYGFQQIFNVIIKNSIMGLTTMKTNYFCKFPLNAIT
jgi:hypothetical protein